MYTLYWEYMAGSIVAQAMLEELQVDYELRYVDMAADEHKSQAYRKINPISRVPSLGLPSGQNIGETAAIVVQLGEDFPDSQLTPQPGSVDRAEFLFWLNVMTTSGYLTVSRHAHPERYAQDEDAISQVEEKAAQDLAGFYAAIEGAIAGDPYFLKSGYSALDIYLAMLAEWSVDRDALFASCPKLASLVQAVSQRAAYQTAVQTHLLTQQAA